MYKTYLLKHLQKKTKQTNLPMLHSSIESALEHDSCPDNIYSSIISDSIFCGNIRRCTLEREREEREDSIVSL